MTELNHNTIFFIKLIRQYLESRGEDCSAPEYALTADLHAILNIASLNKCMSLIYHTICKWGAEYGLNEDLLEQYKKRVLYAAVRQTCANTELKEVIAELNSSSVNYLLLKGELIAKLYPDPIYRSTYDADFFITEEFIEDAEKILIGRGYDFIPNDSQRYGREYRLGDVLTIEVHTILFEDFDKKNRKTIVALEFESEKYHTEVNIFDITAKTYTPDHSLIHLICHHAKHFIAVGISLRHLIDICVFVNEYHEQLNWDFIISSLDRFNIKDFALYMLCICNNYLGMIDVSFLYRDTEIEEDVISLLLFDIVERNAFIKDSALMRGSVHDIVRSVYFEKHGSGAMKSNLFPSVRILKRKYSYAIRHPILLPVAWIHRAFSYLQQKIKGHKVFSPAERMAIAEERVELLKRVRIM